jgi:putative acetyltransferase
MGCRAHETRYGFSVTPVNIVPAHNTPECYRVLTGIWRRSVEATHHFLTIADIDYYAPKVEFDYLPAMQIRMAMVDSTTAGFSGIDGDRLEMLFIDDRFRGKGVGSALLEDALART